MKRVLLFSLILVFTLASITLAKETLTLSQLILIALKHNPEIRISKVIKKEFEIQKKRTLGEFLPYLDLSYTYQREDDGKGLPAYGMSLLGPEFRWNVFNGLQSWYRYRSAKELVKVQGEEVKTTVLEVSLEITQKYLEYFKELAMYKAAVLSLKDARIVLNLARHKYSLGLAPYADVLDAEAKVKKAEHEVKTHLYLAEVAKASVLALAGFDISKWSDIDLIPPSENYTQVPPLTECINIALKNRPELKAKRFQLTAKLDQVKVVRGEFLPSVDVFLQYYKTQKDFSLFPKDNEQFLAGVKVTVPLFEGAQRIADIEKANAEVLKAKLELKREILNVEKEVFSSYRLWESAKSSYESAKAWLKKMEEDFKIIKKKYNAGLASMVDLTTVLARLADARAQVVSTKYQLFEAYYSLKKSMGIIPGLKP